MTWFFVVVVVLAMGGIALVASGRGAPMLDEYDDRPDTFVPESGPLGAHDLRRVRFTLAFRGYRMSEVDALLSRLATEMEADKAWQPADVPAGPVVEAPVAEAVVLDEAVDVRPESPEGPPPPG